MARTTYQIVLSTDGTHKLTASTDDPAELKAAMDHLKNTYKWMEYFIQQGELHKIKDVVTMQNVAEQKTATDSAPICAVHNTPMKWIDKNGGFWSCHQKDGDKWCSYRPGKVVA
jgi:hypothetical protein